MCILNHERRRQFLRRSRHWLDKARSTSSCGNRGNYTKSEDINKVEKFKEAGLKLDEHNGDEMRIKTELYQFARVGLLLGQASGWILFGRYGSNGFTERP